MKFFYYEKIILNIFYSKLYILNFNYYNYFYILKLRTGEKIIRGFGDC